MYRMSIQIETGDPVHDFGYFVTDAEHWEFMQIVSQNGLRRRLHWGILRQVASAHDLQLGPGDEASPEAIAAAQQVPSLSGALRNAAVSASTWR